MQQNNQWFTEAYLPNAEPNIKLSMLISDILYDERSPYGHIQVMDLPAFGRALILDGIIQVVDRDEFIYHEMIVTLPGLLHGNPKKILIVGGASGGAVKQALRFQNVEEVVWVEIDSQIREVAQQYLPTVGEGSTNDERVTIITGDAVEYVKNTHEIFDVVVLDISDPVPDSPSVSLYTEAFYKDIKRVLGNKGILSCHCGALTLQLAEAKMLLKYLSNVFDHVSLRSAVVPSFQLTSFGFLTASAQAPNQSHETLETHLKNLKGTSKYLTTDIIKASGIFPPYLEDQIGF